MSLSRSERRARSFMRVKLAAAILLLLLALAVAVVLYIRAADADYRQERKQAVALALDEGGLAEVEHASPYTWEQTQWIVQGIDAEGEAWILWLLPEGIVKERLADGYSEPQISAQFLLQNPSAEIIRVQPGWFEDQPAWEIRYKIVAGQDRQGIDFYSFKDGTLIQNYVLPGN